MKKVEREYNKFKKEVEKRQDIITMLESIEVLGRYLPDEEIKSDRFFKLACYKDLTHIEIDIAHTSFYRLFDKLLPGLIAHDFFIVLERSIDGLDKWLGDVDTADIIGCKKVAELKRDYYNMKYSCDVLKRRKEIEGKGVDVISFLVDHGMYEVLINLFVSDEVTLGQKYNILCKVLKTEDFIFGEFLDIVPSTYMIEEWDSKIKKEAFTKILTDNLKKVSDKYRKMFNIMVINNINSDEKYDCLSVNREDNFVKFFIQHNLIDINEITFEYNGITITAAAGAFIKRRYNLARYLYELPSYTETDSKIRDDSDMVLLSLLDYNNFSWLINRKNFTNTSDKMLYILGSFDKINSSDSGYKYAKEDIDPIIDPLIRKTKKENYREVKKALTDRKNQKLVSANEQVLLEQKRQQFTAMLRSLNDTLLESVPAKKKIKEVEFKKQ